MRKHANRFKSLSLSLTLLAGPGFLPAQAPSFQEPQAATKEERKSDEIVIDWLKKNAIPIKSVEAGNGFADLQPLKRILADARVVGLGEATHGTREFFQFKRRMVEFLVREMNFNVFAIEASKETWIAGNFMKSTLSKEYDGMISIEQTTRARLLSR
jgi:erythromycin esterase